MMGQFQGFPAKTQFTPIPNLFFSDLLSQISDIAELKTTLHIFWALYKKRGYPRFLTYRELASNASLLKGLKGGDKPPEKNLSNVEASFCDRARGRNGSCRIQRPENALSSRSAGP